MNQENEDGKKSITYLEFKLERFWFKETFEFSWQYCEIWPDTKIFES